MGGISTELRAYITGKMDAYGFEPIGEAPPANQDVLVMLFSKPGVDVHNGKRCAVALSMTGREVLAAGDKYHDLADSRVANAVATWNEAYNDRSTE